MEEEKRSIEEEKKGCVYFFRHIGLSPVKIGYSTNESPIDRFNQFNTYAPYGSEIIGFIRSENAKELETNLHKKYSCFRLNGEWFEITEEQCNKEINLHSKIEDIKQKNNFQIAWAIKVKEEEEEEEYEEIFAKTTREKIFNILETKKNLNVQKLSKKINVSRKTIYQYIKEYNTRKKITL
jgi:hypothetical protein